MRQFLLYFLICLFFGTAAQAQYSETISSDRPGATYSANTLGARVLQFQVGSDFVANNFNDNVRD